MRNKSFKWNHISTIYDYYYWFFSTRGSGQDGFLRKNLRKHEQTVAWQSIIRLRGWPFECRIHTQFANLYQQRRFLQIHSWIYWRRIGDIKRGKLATSSKAAESVFFLSCYQQVFAYFQQAHSTTHASLAIILQRDSIRYPSPHTKLFNGHDMW